MKQRIFKIIFSPPQKPSEPVEKNKLVGFVSFGSFATNFDRF
jgi:hypothetical protein